MAKLESIAAFELEGSPMVTLQEGKRSTLDLNDGRYLVAEPSDDKHAYDN